MKSLKEKAQDFVSIKVHEISRASNHDVTNNDLYERLKSVGITGFTTTKLPSVQGLPPNEIYSIKNASGNGCSVQFDTRKGVSTKLLVKLYLDKFTFSWRIGRAGFIYEYFTQLENIEKEYRGFIAEEEKQEKSSA